MAGTLELPVLREDLRLLPGATEADGSPTWLLYDPVRHRHFKLTHQAFDLLRLWPRLRAGHPGQVAREAGLDVDDQEVGELCEFLVQQQLVQVRDAAGMQRLQAAHDASRVDIWRWLVHHYLFIRVPLWRPDAFLQRTLPWIEPLFDPRVAWALRGLGVLGLLLVVQEWTAFSRTFQDFFSWEGLLFYGLALQFVKSARELGHAFTARRLGCRVTSIGVAFMVGAPVLYTDTTDAWRLTRARDRLRIVTAGVRTELYIAALATLAWCFLPEGAARSAAFFLATTSWVSSLVINLSPFLRFDGYFALSDAWGIENLQPRSFALARWQLREWLFGLGLPPPEPLPARRRRAMVAYALAVWIYRLTLFLGIALLVYHFAFKVLGILLFLIEIVWFIAMPIYKEIRPWWQGRHRLLRQPRTRWTLAVLAGLLLVVVVPWRPSLSMPAMLEAARFQEVFPPEPARVLAIAVRPGDRIEAGQVLFRLESPSLAQELAQAERQLAMVQAQDARKAGSETDLRDSPILAQKAQQLHARLQALRERQAQLEVRAPVAGRASRIQDLQAGQWVSRDEPLVSVRSDEGVRVVGLATESEVHRIRQGAQARWISDTGLRPALSLLVTRIDDTAVSVLPFPELASDHGGPIATRKVADGLWRPQQALYRVELAPLDAASAPAQREPGVLRVEAPPRSLLVEGLRHVAAVLIKESGF